jgi:hypothetical protein
MAQRCGRPRQRACPSARSASGSVLSVEMHRKFEAASDGANQNVLGPGSGSVISPQEAALLTRWAYTDPAAASLWPADPAGGNESEMRSAFDLQSWVDAYNTAHPNAPISLNQ